MKKLLKKVCMFGVSAAMSLSLCSNFVKAAAPNNTSLGVKYGTPAKITPNDNYHYVSLGVRVNQLPYTGQLIQLINSLDISPSNGNSFDLYVRVSPKNNPVASGNYEWTMLQEHGNSAVSKDAVISNTEALKATDPGEYDIYFYLDGLDNSSYNDNAIVFSDNQQQP